WKGCYSRSVDRGTNFCRVRRSSTRPSTSALTALHPRRLDVDRDVAPLALPESGDGQRGSRQMPENDGRPDVRRLEAAHRLKHGAQADRHHDLGDDRDIQRAPRVAGTLQAAGVAQGHGDEETGYAQVSEQLRA